MSLHVEITFDCVPLRSIGRLDVPIDASPAFRALCERVKEAVQRHGLHNTYYLHNARCTYRLTSDERIGMLQFGFEVELLRETCDWLAEPIVAWFRETVHRAVIVEFDRYIAAGDLDRTVQRLETIQAESDAHGGFLGMGL